MTYDTAYEMCQFFLDEVVWEIINGREVALPGFGIFRPRITEYKKGQQYYGDDGVALRIYFKPSSLVKKAFRKRYAETHGGDSK